ncbi:membrane protein US29 [Cercopithecine betaherpesvirus 5]|uniref:Membrane protein US29 n=1 Tax=Simian cytomegalovirus (strain Colburn) TaxID=50292 RepID=G8XTN7_SCMVC|nr:membrane protein US29 [Cercopithecine betaherpesvirus 5]AEV80529.1 membrane protein US29 [Cercopithecine betaherpesvirus 5]
MRNPVWHVAVWWITLGCAPSANVNAYRTSATVGAQSIVVHETSSPRARPDAAATDVGRPASSPPPTPRSPTLNRADSAVFKSPSDGTAGPTRQRAGALGRRRRQRQRKPYSCVTATHWTTDLVFTSCENTPSFVKLEGVRRWALNGQPLGETSYYGGCCRLRHGEDAYIILANGYGPAVHGHALRVDYSLTNCSQPHVPFPTRLEIVSTPEIPSRCRPHRLYFYGLQCPSQLAFSTAGLVDVRQCPPVLSLRPVRTISVLDDRLRGIRVDIFICLVLIAILIVEIFLPRHSHRHPAPYWRRVSKPLGALRLTQWVKRILGYLWPTRYPLLEKTSELASDFTWTALFPCPHTSLSRPPSYSITALLAFPILRSDTSQSYCVNHLPASHSHGTYESDRQPLASPVSPVPIEATTDIVHHSPSELRNNIIDTETSHAARGDDRDCDRDCGQQLPDRTG